MYARYTYNALICNCAVNFKCAPLNSISRERFSTRSSSTSWVLHTFWISWRIAFEQFESTDCMSVVSVLTVYFTGAYGGHVLYLRCLRVDLISEGEKWSPDVRPDDLTSDARIKSV